MPSKLIISELDSSYLFSNILQLQERLEFLESNTLKSGPHKRFLEENVDENNVITCIWLLITAALILMMFSGLALIEVGRVHSKNVKSAIFKHLCTFNIAALICCVTFLPKLLDTEEKDFQPDDSSKNSWLNYSFCLILVVIMNAGTSERARHPFTIVLTFFTVAIIHPLCCKWVWNEDSFLHHFGAIDGAGMSGVHAMGGLASLIAASQMRHRSETFCFIYKDNSGLDTTGWMHIISTAGIFLFFLARIFWNTFALSPHSTLGLHIDTRASLNTLTAGTAAFSCSVIWRFATFRRYNINECQNLMVAGAIAVSSCCWVVDVWAATCVGIGAWGLYMAASQLALRLGVDDPLAMFATHGVGGFWGMLAPGLFARADLLETKLGHLPAAHLGGGFFTDGATGLLWAQCFSAFLMFEWCSLVYFVTLFFSKNVLGVRLGIDEDLRILGLDYVYHDESPDFVWDEQRCATRRQYEAARRRAEARSRMPVPLRRKRRRKQTPSLESTPQRLSKKRSIRRTGSAMAY